MNVGEEPITSLFIGEMGIKTAIVGEEIIYNRTGGFIYIYLDTTNTKEN